MRPIRPAAKPIGEFPPIHHWHHQIQQDEIRPQIFEQAQGFLPVSSLSSDKAFRLQDLRQCLEDVEVVVDHQDCWGWVSVRRVQFDAPDPQSEVRNR